MRGSSHDYPVSSGVVWPADAQFGAKGFSYCPYLWNWACKHGFAEADHTTGGKPALAHEGDIYLWDWNSDGVADHAGPRLLMTLELMVSLVTSWATTPGRPKAATRESPDPASICWAWFICAASPIPAPGGRGGHAGGCACHADRGPAIPGTDPAVSAIGERSRCLDLAAADEGSWMGGRS